MDPTIASGLISAGAAIIVCVISQIFTQRRTEALLEYRLTALEKKVDKHNNLIERMYDCEGRLDVQDEKMKELTARVDDLK